MAHDLGTADFNHQAAAAFFLCDINSSIAQMTSLSPAEDWSRMIGRKWSQSIFPSTISESKTTAANLIDASWFRQALEILADVKATADSAPEIHATHETAEHLIAHFAAWPEHIRPRFSVDALDRLSFSSKSSRHYLHATIEPELGLHWYAELDGNEIPMPDAENQDILRAYLPNSLSALLQA